MQKNYIWGGVVLAVLLVVLAIWQAKYNPSGSMLGPNQTTGQSGTTQPTPTPSVTATPGSTGSGAKLAYAEALKKYPYRIQFVKCSANPGTISLKRNQPLMLDNRDNANHTIRVAGLTYVIKKYDYAVAYIAKVGNHNLTCDNGGSAKINVEK